MALSAPCTDSTWNHKNGHSNYMGGGVIPYQADIGKGTILGYQACGIVIHKRCVIGTGCHISQGVTIGGTSGLYEVPVLGENVQVGANAVIIGPVHVGSGSVIGAGAVVT
ncbi:MAG: DapH/DapD/GlmU-related protein, partial [Eggerthella sp.]|nr:DapH/DapD/GlmU-related protein [Eggerthella sp.]